MIEIGLADVYKFYCERCEEEFVWTEFRKCPRCVAKGPVRKLAWGKVRWTETDYEKGDRPFELTSVGESTDTNQKGGDE